MHRVLGICGLSTIELAAETYLSAAAPEVAEFRAALYEREARVAYRPGDVLLYRHDTWHRGTPFEAGGAATGAQYDVSSRGCRVGEHTASRMGMVGVSRESVP